LVTTLAHAAATAARPSLLEHVWGYDYDGTDRTIDSHIAQVRRKLGAYGEQIVTSAGYRWKSETF
jgi:DNA-binding response OmpR family regulator